MSAGPDQLPLFITAGPGYVALTPKRTAPDDLSDLRFDRAEYERQNAEHRLRDSQASRYQTGHVPAGRFTRDARDAAA